MRKIFVILLLSVFWACNKKNVSIIDSFNINQRLTHKVFDLQNASKELRDPHSIAISGNTITVWNPRASDLFTTVDIATKRVIKHWGTRGQGPNEFFGPVDMYNNYSETGLNIWNVSTGKLWFFSHNNLESDSTYFQTIPTDLDKPESQSYNFAPSVIQIDTSIFFVAAGGRSNRRLALLDIKNNEVKEVGDFPPEDINTQMSVGVRNLAYDGRIRYNSSLKKLVFMVYNCEMFEIYNVINGTNVELAMGNYTTVPKYSESNVSSRGINVAIVETVGNGKGRNLSLTVSDENIFILYQDYKKAGMVKETDFNYTADMVLVFDWNGKPVKIYELDCLVSDIEYDKIRNRLWALHYNKVTLDPEIIYFEL